MESCLGRGGCRPPARIRAELGYTCMDASFWAEVKRSVESLWSMAPAASADLLPSALWEFIRDATDVYLLRVMFVGGDFETVSAGRVDDLRTPEHLRGPITTLLQEYHCWCRHHPPRFARVLVLGPWPALRTFGYCADGGSCGRYVVVAVLCVVACASAEWAATASESDDVMT